MDGELVILKNPCESFKSNSPIQGFTDDQLIVGLSQTTFLI